jgi:hypothetical protein
VHRPSQLLRLRYMASFDLFERAYRDLGVDLTEVLRRLDQYMLLQKVRTESVDDGFRTSQRGLARDFQSDDAFGDMCSFDLLH